MRDGFLRRALTAYRGYLTHEETSALPGRPWVRPEDILGIADRQLDPAPSRHRHPLGQLSAPGAGEAVTPPARADRCVCDSARAS